MYNQPKINTGTDREKSMHVTSFLVFHTKVSRSIKIHQTVKIGLKGSQNGKIHSINKMSMLQAWLHKNYTFIGNIWYKNIGVKILRY